MTVQLPLCQRWLHRQASYRPGREVIDPSRYGVDVLDEAVARDGRLGLFGAGRR